MGVLSLLVTTIITITPMVSSYSLRFSRQAFYNYEFHSTDRSRMYHDYFDESHLAPKTKWAQRHIYNHQNPKDCSKVKFLATLGFSSGGLGAEMTGVASHLSYALANDFVLVWARGVTSKYFNDSGGECGSRGFSCIFQPLSNCESSMGEPNQTIHEIFNIFLIPLGIERVMFKHFPKISHAQALHWWKAQSIAYVMRPNAAALDSIVRMRKDRSLHFSSREGNINIPFPLPSGSVNMHIRRGDKIHEMEYVPAKAYADAYHNLIASEPLGFTRRWVYVTSDTLNPILEARDLLLNSEEENYTYAVLYSLMPRMEHGFQHDRWQNFTVNSTHSTLLLLMELFMAIEADAWIGTRISVWGRTIDLLRCVWVDKCQSPFFEVGSLKQRKQGDQHMYYEFVVPQHAKKYGKQQNIWKAPDSLFEKY